MCDPAYDAVGRLTVEEYLALEEHALERHEYVAGAVYAITGATIRHKVLLLNVASRPRSAAAGGPCRAFVADVKVRPTRDVFSPSTEGTDRREKLLAYRQIPSLRAYLIVSHRRRAVDVYVRDEPGEWQSERVTEGAVHVPCPSTTLTIDEIYAGVTLPAVSEPEPAGY